MISKKKLVSILWPIAYLVLTVAVIITFSMAFHSYYFTPIYVSGSSMQPTLQGNEWHHYGYIDTHKAAIDKLERFNIVTTFYPFSNYNDYEGGYTPGKENVVSKNATYKIKRVYAFPGEYFKFTVDLSNFEDFDSKKGQFDTDYYQEKVQDCVKFYVKDSLEAEWGEPIDLPFDRKIRIDQGNRINYYEYESPRPLAENEYFVIGDNYMVSSDSLSESISKNKFSPIYYENIQGVLIAIEGLCKIDNKQGEGAGILSNVKEKKPYKTPIYFI